MEFLEYQRNNPYGKILKGDKKEWRKVPTDEDESERVDMLDKGLV